MEIHKYPRIQPVGDTAITVEFENEIDLRVNQRVHVLARLLQKDPPRGMGEAVPSYRTLLVHYDPELLSYATLKDFITAKLPGVEHPTQTQSRLIDIPTLYGGEHGPDLEFVAQYNQLTPEEVVQIHASKEYPVYMLGFTPGFPYLGGVDERIATPRLDSPRTHVPGGSVGIAGTQTGIYPVDSPGGWRIIGYTPSKLFDPFREPPALLAPGDRVRFASVSKEELNDVAESP